MKESDLEQFGKVLERIMKKDSVLLFWALGKNYPLILRLIEKYGYKYINILLVWIKLYKNKNV